MTCSPALMGELVQHLPDSALQRFEADQHDLDLLCADRALDSTEPFPPNDWYGASRVLKTYAQLPQSMQLLAVVPHGVYFGDDCVQSYERAPLPAAMVFEPQRLHLYGRNGVIAIPSAAPFCYAHRLVNRGRPRLGTLYVPMHSTYFCTHETDWAEVADSAKRLDSDENPVTVLMYWRDYVLGRHVHFLERGLPLVSAGHIFDRDFLLRLAHLFQSHRVVATNGMGSHVFYATHAGCDVDLDPIDYWLSESDEVEPDPLLSTTRAAEWARLERLFTQDDAESRREQREESDYYLGASRLLAPAELRDVLLWLERLDRHGRLVLRREPLPTGVLGFQGVPGKAAFIWRRRGLQVRGTIERCLRRLLEKLIAALRWMVPMLRDVRLPRRIKP